MDNTPWEKRLIKTNIPDLDCYVYVKREDMCCPGGPDFSKVRGVVPHLLNGPKRPIGVLDTYHSKAGWGVAWICEALGFKCYVFHPRYKHEPALRIQQVQAQEHGAHLIPLKAGRSAILMHQARKMFADMTGGKGEMLPNGLHLQESIDATRHEVEQYTPLALYGGTWVVSASSGTLAAGVAQGIAGKAKLIVHMGFSRSIPKMRELIGDARFIDEGFEYRDKVEFPCPFPCNPYYDLKAWRWLSNNIFTLDAPVVFWNIGA